jgi:hypothetical protein
MIVAEGRMNKGDKVEITIREHKCVYDRMGEGPHLTLLHSVGLSTREGWRNQLGPLARHFRVLGYDLAASASPRLAPNPWASKPLRGI